MRIKTRTVNALKDKFLKCLMLGHSWGDAPIMEMVLENGLTAWKQDLRCTSCGCLRHDTLEPKTFDLWRRHYDYPVGYGVIEPYTRADLRAERATRTIVKQARAAGIVSPQFTDGTSHE
jgi:hypothetical protein